MKNRIAAALSLLLMAGASPAALAQDAPADAPRIGRGDHEPRGGGRSERREDRAFVRREPSGAPTPPAPPAAAAAPQAAPAPRVGGPGWARRDGGRGETRPAPTPGAAPGFNQDRDGHRDHDGRPGSDRGRDRNWDRGRDDHDRGDRGRDRHDGDRGDRNWDHNDRNRNDHGRPRWDHRNYPSVFHSPRRFRGSIYRPPSGFSFRSWGYGEILPPAWYAPSYRILDWWAYDLPMPPPGYEWVRSGPDALLVDEFTGRVVQVVRNLFW